MALPSNVGSGTVIGRFIDNSGNAYSGTVTFTPAVARLRDVSADTGPVTILPKPTTVSLDVTGSLFVNLLSTDDPDISPLDWTYVVTFALVGHDVESFSIDLPEGETVDLTVVSPVASSGGTPVIQGPAGVGVPSGGTTGQVLAKATGADYATHWVDQTGGTGGGGTGADGLSAYEIAVNDGFSGTELQWLASLKGDKGDKGDPGTNGAQGIQGVKGDKGDKGDTGATGAPGTPYSGVNVITVPTGTTGFATQPDGTLWVEYTP